MARTDKPRKLTSRSRASLSPAYNSRSGDRKESLLKTYFLINGIFSAFCVIQMLIIRAILPSFAGLAFFFFFIIVAFFIVSMLDYLSNRLGIPADEDVNR